MSLESGGHLDTLEERRDLLKKHSEIAFIDDEEMIRRLGPRLLCHSLGYERVQISDRAEPILQAIQAEAQKGKKRFDTVIIDKNMSGMGGYEFLKQVLTLPPEFQPSVILMSGEDLKDHDLTLMKPFKSEELQAVLDLAHERLDFEQWQKQRGLVAPTDML